jgi:hypothetical protein
VEVAEILAVFDHVRWEGRPGASECRLAGELRNLAPDTTDDAQIG